MAPGPVWTGAENLAPTGIRSPDRPVRSESLYRLSYPGPQLSSCNYKIGDPVLLENGRIFHIMEPNDVRSSIVSSNLKHRANDARDNSSSYSNRRDQSGLDGCCTAMWKANGKTTTLLFFLDSLFPKTEISYMRDASSGDKIIRR